MKTALTYIAEARKEMLKEAKSTITGTCEVETILNGSNVTIIVTNASAGPENTFGDKISGFAVDIKGGGNSLSWPLFALADIDSKNSPIASGKYPGYAGNNSLYYTNEITHSSFFSLEQETIAAINSVYISKSSIKVEFSSAKSEDLAGKYKSFKVIIPISSVFGPKGDALIKNLESKDWTDPKNEDEFFTKYNNLKLEHSQKSQIKFITDSK